MALVVADRVQETTTTTGTGTYTLAGAKDGFQSFAAVGDGNTTYYACTDGADYEVGIGTYTASGTTLARTTIIESSNSDAAVSWSAGDKDIFVTLPASKALVQDADDDVALADSEKLIFGTGGDLEIYHDGSNSYIKEGGTGDLRLQAAHLYIQNTFGQGMIDAQEGGSVNLYHNTSLKLGTTSSGVNVTGNIAVSGTVDGVDIATNIPSSLGTAGQVLTVNSGATAGEWASLPSASLAQQEFTATSGQTVFTVTDGISDADNVSVYINGVKLFSTDVTISAAANTVTLGSGAATGDLVTVTEITGTSGGGGGGSGQGVTTYTNKAAIDAVSSPSEGDLAYDLAADQLYIRTTSAWKRIALGVDETPIIITEPATTHTLNDDGTTSTVTMLASDPEGFGITYGIAYPNATNALPSQLATATSINQTTGVYTFDPSTTESDAGTVNVRLSASDGARTTTRIIALTLEFLPKWYGVRGLVAGGRSSSVASMDTIEYFTINTSTFSSTDFGDLTGGYRENASCSDGSRAVFAGGRLDGTPANTIQYVETGTTGNATDFGDMTTDVNGAAGVSNGTRGCFGGDFSSNIIDVITIQTTGNATDFGNMTISANTRAGASNGTYGMFAGGSGYSNVMDRITIETNGNAVDHGDLATARTSAAGMSSKQGRGIFGGGYATSANTNSIEYISIGGNVGTNASSFGTLTAARQSLAASSDGTYGVFLGGNAGSGYSNIVDKITIGTEANATDIGDLSVARREFTATSGAAA